MKRFGAIIKIKSEKLEEYKEIHSNVWPEISKAIYECNIRNYSIYFKDGFLFSYFEYIGNDFKADTKKMTAGPIYQKWLSICDPMQIPLETRKKGEWWAYMEEVFHQI